MARRRADSRWQVKVIDFGIAKVEVLADRAQHCNRSRGRNCLLHGAGAT